jgi:hypothetical protein
VLAGGLLLGTLTRFPAAAVYPGLRHAAAADVLIGDLLAELPGRAVLLSADVETAFVVGYQRLVEGRRPDVDWAHLGFLAHAGARQRLADAAPDLLPLLRAPVSLATVARLDRLRPVRLEVDEHLPPDLQPRVVPDGATWRLGPDRGPSRSSRPPALALTEAASDRQVRGFIAWRAYNDAVLACARGMGEVARQRLSTLHDLMPDDQLGRALTGQCPALSSNGPLLRRAP